MNEKGGGTGCLSLIGIAFIVLKLVDVIDWSWFWVLSPFLAEIMLFLLIMAFVIRVKSD